MPPPLFFDIKLLPQPQSKNQFKMCLTSECHTFNPSKSDSKEGNPRKRLKKKTPHNNT